MEILPEFRDESICDNLRTSPKPHCINMGAFEYENKIITQNCDVEKKTANKKAAPNCRSPLFYLFSKPSIFKRPRMMIKVMTNSIIQKAID